jgi:hypothetical protein
MRVVRWLPSPPRRAAAAVVCYLLSPRGAAAWTYRGQTRDDFLTHDMNCPPGAADEEACHTRDFMYIQKHEFATASMHSFNGMSILASSFHACPFSLVRSWAPDLAWRLPCF